MKYFTQTFIKMSLFLTLASLMSACAEEPGAISEPNSDQGGACSEKMIEDLSKIEFAVNEWTLLVFEEQTLVTENPSPAATALFIKDYSERVAPIDAACNTFRKAHSNFACYSYDNETKQFSFHNDEKVKKLCGIHSDIDKQLEILQKEISALNTSQELLQNQTDGQIEKNTSEETKEEVEKELDKLRKETIPLNKSEDLLQNQTDEQKDKNTIEQTEDAINKQLDKVLKDLVTLYKSKGQTEEELNMQLENFQKEIAELYKLGDFLQKQIEEKTATGSQTEKKELSF